MFPFGCMVIIVSGIIFMYPHSQAGFSSIGWLVFPYLDSRLLFRYWGSIGQSIGPFRYITSSSVFRLRQWQFVAAILVFFLGTNQKKIYTSVYTIDRQRRRQRCSVSLYVFCIVFGVCVGTVLYLVHVVYCICIGCTMCEHKVPTYL